MPVNCLNLKKKLENIMSRMYIVFTLLTVPHMARKDQDQIHVVQIWQSYVCAQHEEYDLSLTSNRLQLKSYLQVSPCIKKEGGSL